MKKLAQRLALLSTVGWLTVALGQATPTVLVDPRDASKRAGNAKLSDGGYALEVHLEQSNAVIADGGVITAAQGAGQDGGAWAVTGAFERQLDELRRLQEQQLIDEQAGYPAGGVR